MVVVVRQVTHAGMDAADELRVAFRKTLSGSFLATNGLFHFNRHLGPVWQIESNRKFDDAVLDGRGNAHADILPAFQQRGNCQRTTFFPLLRHEAAEDAEVRRVPPRARAPHRAHPFAQREPVVRLERLQFAVGVQTHLRHVAEEVQKPIGRAAPVCYLRFMPTSLDPAELRPALHARIDQLDGESLAVLHRVALQLELEELVSQVDADFDALRKQGRLERLPEIIREARAAIRARTAA